MAGVVYDSSRIKVYENLSALCNLAGESQEWCDRLWQELLTDGELYAALLYFMKHHMFSDRMNCRGYRLTDLFIWQMDRYNLLHDTGKNTAECRKMDMILRAFYSMAEMKKDPETFLRRLGDGRGQDRY